MGLHVEINGEASPREWRALAALASVMLGETSKTAIVAEAIAVTPSSEPITPMVEGILGAASIEPPPPPPAIADEAGDVPPPPTGDPVSAAERPNPVVPGVNVDSRGLPWDIRIHASTKSTTKNGEWVKKRNVDPKLVEHVEAELRNIMAAVPAVPPPPADVPPPPVQLDPAAAFGGASSTPAADAPPPASDVATPMAEFARVMRIVTARQAAGTLATETATAIVQQLGLTAVKDLAIRPDLIPAFEALLP